MREDCILHLLDDIFFRFRIWWEKHGYYHVQHVGVFACHFVVASHMLREVLPYNLNCGKNVWLTYMILLLRHF